MKRILSVPLTIVAVLLLNGCGGNSTADEVSAVRGPAKDFVGATKFSKEMVSGQSFYTKTDENEDGEISPDEWTKYTLNADGSIDKEHYGEWFPNYATYTIQDGIIVAHSVSHTPRIDFNTTLVKAEDTYWDVTVTKNDGSTENDTLYLELMFNKALLVGKTFSGFTFTENTISGIDDGVKMTQEYIIEDGILIRDPKGERARRSLIKVESDGSLWSWNMEDPEGNLFKIQ